LRLTPEIRQQLEALGPFGGNTPDIGEALLWLAAMDRPGVAIDPYRRHLQNLVEATRDYTAGEDPALVIERANMRIESLHQIIIRRFGYTSPESTDLEPHDFNMMRVIDNRNGSPLCIGMLYLYVSQQLGWGLEGINFPGALLLKTTDIDTPIIFDPISCLPVSVPDLRLMLKAVRGQDAELSPVHYQPHSHTDLLLVLLDQIKCLMLGLGQLDPVRHVLEAMILINPKDGQLWRESGLIHARLDHIAEAINALEEYLKYSRVDDASYDASLLLQDLKQKLI